MIHLRTDTAQDPQAKLNEQRGFVQLLVDDPCEVVKMTQVVTFELEACPMPLSQAVAAGLDVAELIPKYSLAGGCEKLFLPGEFHDTRRRRKKTYIDRTHVEGRHFRTHG